LPSISRERTSRGHAPWQGGSERSPDLGTVSAEIPVRERWCEIRQTVFGWTTQKFPFGVKTAHALKIREPHVITATGNIGAEALVTNNGSDNTASGAFALFSSGGSENTATGVGALENNNTGSYNTASGFNALNGDPYSDLSGSYNTADGISALQGNTGGINNTASGSYYHNASHALH
jgi:hypothetical protein